MTMPARDGDPSETDGWRDTHASQEAHTDHGHHDHEFRGARGAHDIHDHGETDPGGDHDHDHHDHGGRGSDGPGHGGHRQGHGGHGGHGHQHGVALGRTTGAQRRRLWAATGLNLAIVVVQAIAGIAAGSIGLLADAGHNLTDTAGVALALVALMLSQRPPSARRTFGGVRWPVLAAQANAAAILVVTALLAVEALRRLGSSASVDGPLVVAVALIAAVINGGCALVVRDRDGDLNTRAAVLHLAGDAAVSVAVAVSGLVIWLVGGWYWLDPTVSLAISLLIAAQGVRLLVSASRVLLEAAPDTLDVAVVRADILRHDHVLDVHDLHVWSLSDQVFAASVHVELGHLDPADGDGGGGHPSLAQAREVSDEIRAMLAARHGITHVTVEAECEPCVPPPGDPCGLGGGRPGTSSVGPGDGRDVRGDMRSDISEGVGPR
ncbi:cation diffusion facilitator family transporter [Frankia sp. R82]|uniref:cation diffusion facilitator family transporter n=1 Tax=Frankia sp. R82 TaxID=2950553 RepID=UPI002043B23D|nr:cation diffusion facilitator family transporter [Frankia sp. R82]MCM3886448.1 cation diffusion facilitator family transporter [Frankia sp. R82]